MLVETPVPPSLKLILEEIQIQSVFFFFFFFFSSLDIYWTAGVEAIDDLLLDCVEPLLLNEESQI